MMEWAVRRWTLTGSGWREGPIHYQIDISASSFQALLFSNDERRGMCEYIFTWNVLGEATAAAVDGEEFASSTDWSVTVLFTIILRPCTAQERSCFFLSFVYWCCVRFFSFLLSPRPVPSVRPSVRWGNQWLIRWLSESQSLAQELSDSWNAASTSPATLLMDWCVFSPFFFFFFSLIFN